MSIDMAMIESRQSLIYGVVGLVVGFLTPAFGRQASLSR